MTTPRDDQHDRDDDTGPALDLSAWDAPADRLTRDFADTVIVRARTAESRRPIVVAAPRPWLAVAALAVALCALSGVVVGRLLPVTAGAPPEPIAKATFAAPGQAAPQPAAPDAIAELQRRLDQLEVDNRALHAELDELLAWKRQLTTPTPPVHPVPPVPLPLPVPVPVLVPPPPIPTPIPPPPPAPVSPTGVGELEISSAPPARVLIDNRDMGETPLLLRLPIGRHKVTLVIGQDRYTYATTITENQTQTMVKDLRN